MFTLLFLFYPRPSLLPYLILSLAVQEAVRKAQEELAKQKEVIMAQDKELKVNTFVLFIFLLF